MIHFESVLQAFQMQIQPFFEPKQPSKSLLHYEGASKDPVTGSTTAKMKQPSQPEEYPMGEWNPASESSSTAETVLNAIGQSTIIDPGPSPTSAELVTTFFPMSEW